MSLWKFLTSLRLTVVLLSLSIILVFIGTVAQADEGLYQAQERYFKHWFVVGAMMWGKHVPIILPGGYTLGVLLLVNLVAAHIKRFKWGGVEDRHPPDACGDHYPARRSARHGHDAGGIADDLSAKARPPATSRIIASTSWSFSPMRAMGATRWSPFRRSC